ncbi:NTP transferase domain-containing protein [Candidatus Woesearchaeota archaeon]|nr:NTP transferase domain-containing protein [Candidatus Woesearchaeota archaeon]
MKTRVSISMDKEILGKLDKEIDNINIFSRSEAIEKIVEKYVSEKKKCVILAGGEPSKLYMPELKCFRPLINIKGRTLIRDIIEKVRKARYEDILIIGSKEVLSAIYNEIGDGKSLKASIEYLEEKDHIGSAKTLNLAKPHIKNTFLFLPCDHYFEINLEEVEAYHRRNKGTATLVIYSGTEHEWKKSSIVSLEGNVITKYIEKPKNAETHLTSMMIGFAEPEIFESVPEGKITWSLQENVFAALAKRGRLIGYVFSGNWKNIHSKEDVYELNL